MKKTITALFLLAAMPAFAQDSCNCRLNLQQMVAIISNNYAGFKDKVTPASQQQYSAFTDSLMLAAAKSNNIKTCYDVLEKYRLFFLDKHLQLRADLPAKITYVKDSTAPPEQTTWTKKTVLQYFKSNKLKLDPIEGVWKTEGYEIGVIPDKKSRHYDAVILSATNKNWKEGMLKFRSEPPVKNNYATEYGMADFTKKNSSATVYRNFMTMEGFGSWQKIYPPVKDSFTLLEFNNTYGGEVQWTMLDKTTLYIRLKSCDLANKSILDSLVKSNRKQLKTIPDWIVDFRGNQGGSTDVFQSLLPYFYTHPMYEKGDRHWMTPGNTAEFKKYIAENKSAMDTGTLNYINRLVVFGEQNPNGWHDTGLDSMKFDHVLPFPQRIAVLSDRNNGSSGETFLLMARGLGNKATIFGENSAGYMDYGDLLPYALPCNKFSLYVPSRRSNYINEGIHYGYVGIAPQVFIPASNTNWVQFVLDYWKKK